MPLEAVNFIDKVPRYIYNCSALKSAYLYFISYFNKEDLLWVKKSQGGK